MNDIIEVLKEFGLCEEGHFINGDIHTNLNINPVIYTNHKVAEKIVHKLYHKILNKHRTDTNDVDFDVILTDGYISTILAFPLSLMFKIDLYETGSIISGGMKKIVFKSTITDQTDLQQIIGLYDNIVDIYCITNMSSDIVYKGINIIELLPIEKWTKSDCPICSMEKEL